MAAPEGFRYQAASDDRVFIYHHDRLAVTLSGRDAVTFLMRVERSDEQGAQLAMAKATGNYRRGNERASRRR